MQKFLPKAINLELNTLKKVFGLEYEFASEKHANLLLKNLKKKKNNI
jgi:hypothetical protein